MLRRCVRLVGERAQGGGEEGEEGGEEGQGRREGRRKRREGQGIKKEGQGKRKKREEALIQVCVYVQKASGCVVPLEMV